LLQAPAGQDEHAHLLSALTTNVTHFFREKHHFSQLKEEILPPIMARAKDGARVRIWSAACSAGQEAYCMAATVLDVCPDAHRLDVKILATDIDPVVLETAKSGHYPIEQLAAIETAYRENMIDADNADENMFSIRPETGALVTFAQLNLMDAWPMRRPFDIIMCRNAAIYFDKATQVRLWSRFAAALTEDGFLMIGHSERLTGDSMSRFRSVGVTAYQRTS
jgi:chemotaxis protein methyltransferase CheR